MLFGILKNRPWWRFGLCLVAWFYVCVQNRPPRVVPVNQYMVFCWLDMRANIHLLPIGVKESVAFGLALGELALLTGALEAELLAFAFAGIAADQVGALEGTLEVFVHNCQGFADTEADGFGLSFVAAAGNDGADVELIDLVENRERLLEFGQQVLAVGEVFSGRFAVNHYSAFTGLQADAGGGAFAAADGVKVTILGHYLVSFTEIRVGFWGACWWSAPA